MNIKINIDGPDMKCADAAADRRRAEEIFKALWEDSDDMTGWVRRPVRRDKDEFEKILKVAGEVREKAELMVVIGIGGSYMGAKAAVEALAGENADRREIDVKFAGINFCSAYHRQIIEEIKSKETVLCVISKSGNTMEIKAAFDTLKAVMEEKYGADETASRIVTITDGKSGALRRETEKRRYTSFEIPADIGGRYSIVTAAGMFPMAAAGIDIIAFADGAAAMAKSEAWLKLLDGGSLIDYAVARNQMIKRGKTVEAIEFFDSRFSYFGEWLKQLYGESEGKEGKGLFPVTLNFSTDLHSMGQYLQQGNKIFFETIVTLESAGEKLEIPRGELKGRTFEDLNRAAAEGVIAAHRKIDIPIIHICIPRLDAFYFGQAAYFFEMTCAITAMLMNVNPFDQPGVEAYKSEMRKLLK